MDSFPWNEHFVTGLPEVDRQHRHLVGVINEFGELVAQDDLDLASVDKVFSELVAYARYHFREEEHAMSAGGIDSRHLEAHVEQHRFYVEEVTAMRGEVDATDPQSAGRLLRFLIHWLAYHILESDQSMAAQLKAIAAGKDPAAAYAEQEQRSHAATEPLTMSLARLFALVSTRNQELRELNRDLEGKVAERTAALTRANQRLEELALTDVLTGLPNRRSAMHRIERLWDESAGAGTTLACLMIDADHFKQINDTCGHEAGDAYLRQLARALEHAVRTDDVVCRLGGDEFLVICPQTPLEGALNVGELARAAVAALPAPEGGGLEGCSVSVGVAVSHPRMEGPEALIRAADVGAYLAKRAGRNCVRAVSTRAREGEAPARAPAPEPE